ncbi:tetratricopeptide repeat protein [Pseudoalteromonas sp. T1lg88]|uniref:tetratricopeptide repeat protein n=1 Tax=Pseudoalteromonas sp. T1lg88 TaxID=2077104 RepID=UPI000CF7134E|nr:tetratricopeptide repeat protein [Pseudoalteromonas sp. T1lg88]
MRFYLVLLCACLLLTGCASSQSKGDAEKLNLVQLENQAETAYVAGHLDMAEGMYRQLLTVKEGYAPAWFRLGNIYARTNRLNAAVSAYQRCIQIDNEHEKAWFNLAVTRMRQSTNVIIQAQEHVTGDSMIKAQMDELFIQLMKLQTGKADNAKAHTDT